MPLLRRRHSSTPAAPPPIVAPVLNTRCALLVDGARYGGRIDDVTTEGLVVAAPDATLSPERPVLVEWKDAAGVWHMPGEVTLARVLPFPTTTVRPTGPSECVAPSAAELRVSARVLGSTRLPAGTRVPVTTINVRDEQLSVWTILPLDRGDRIECVASLPDGRLTRARCQVETVQPHQGTWLLRADCVLEDPTDPATLALIDAIGERDRALRAA